MYKITSKIIGSIRVGNKELGYQGFIIVDKITNEISELQKEGIIKVKEIKPITLAENKTSAQQIELLTEETIMSSENKKNKKNKSILGGN